MNKAAITRSKLQLLVDVIGIVLNEYKITIKKPVIIKRKGKQTVALVDAAELSSMQETLHLLSTPANARALFDALEEAETGQLKRYANVEDWIKEQRAKVR